MWGQVIKEKLDGHPSDDDDEGKGGGGGSGVIEAVLMDWELDGDKKDQPRKGMLAWSVRPFDKRFGKE